mgnify:CR=1 FL=1
MRSILWERRRGRKRNIISCKFMVNEKWNFIDDMVEKEWLKMEIDDIIVEYKRYVDENILIRENL